MIENIRIFKRVAETKSFSKVALERQLSQPTISKAIKGLENQLGLILFRRTTRGLSLTVEGQKLYNSGGELIDHFERVIAEVKSQKQNLVGELRISASLAFARLVVTPILADFTKMHPGLRLNFILSDGYVDLVENSIDLAIRIGDLADSSMRSIRLGTSRRSLYASKAYLKHHGRPKSIEDLHRHRLLYYTRISDRPQWPLTTVDGQRKPFYFEPAFKTDGSDLMREAVLAGMGIALLPTWMMLEPEKIGSVIRLFPEASKSPAPIHALSASGRDLSAKQRSLVDYLRDHFDKSDTLSPRDR